MITVNIEQKHSDKIDAVRALCDELCLRDANFGGATISVVISDYTDVDDDDEIRGATLLTRVYDAICAEQMIEVDADWCRR